MTVQTLSKRWQALGRDALLLLARIAPGAVFWQSGRTKVDGWQLRDSALYLFQEEYRLPLIDPAPAAGLAAFAEHLLPILLLLGLGTRLAAAGLLGMTLVIQLLVYPDAWATHGTWAVALLLLIGQGGGRLSLDHGLQRLWQSRHNVSQNPCAGHADPEQCLRAPQ
ncbi:putative oxidoreductase [Aquipseudomonas alcaligenes]|uniref:DoxX family membrane protein n=1 Tax=Aquipseudomonas alcaligenes TaxID=43263 RepID=UPI0009565166|nr:DoxX family membrane protein [Pseudomonas alcaligenes]SIS08926.1 putative oxidoreductase [Pseudomonas alcaligenes]